MIDAKKYPHVFADPDASNAAAIATYTKVGFKKIQENELASEVWMVLEL